MSNDAIERAILGFVREELLGADQPLAADTNLLDDGMLDSLGVVRLATFVDETYGLNMQPADFVIDNFKTATALAAYVRSARQRSAATPTDGD